MFLIFAVLAFLSAAFLLFRYTKRHDPELLDQTAYSAGPPLNARPLFAPSDEDLKREANKEKARAIAKREYHANAESRAIVDDAVREWRARPDAKNTADLLRVAAHNGLDGDLSRAAGEVIEKFRESGIDGLTSDDLVALLDSHIRLLSNAERSSGAIFWLKQEAAKLRTESDVNES